MRGGVQPLRKPEATRAVALGGEHSVRMHGGGLQQDVPAQDFAPTPPEQGS